MLDPQRLALRNPTAYQMLTSFSITNFKCYKTLELKNLRQINVVSGDNASGKTALLEAVMIAARATPDPLFAVTAFRGVTINQQPIATGTSQITFGVTAQSVAAMGELLCHKGIDDSKQSEKSFSFRFIDSEKKSYSVVVTVDTSSATRLRNAPVATMQSRIISIKRKTGKEQSIVDVGINAGGQITVNPQSPQPFGPVSYFFASSAVYAEADNLLWFSELREKNYEALEAVLKFMTHQFPFISTLEILQPNNVSGLYARLNNGDVRRLTMISSGIHKMVSILLAIAENASGVVLIDEIENGIFHSRYADFWGAIIDFALKQNCQLFVSSHSLECLQALSPAMSEHQSDVCLLRTAYRNDQFCVDQIVGGQLATALAGNVEIR